MCSVSLITFFLKPYKMVTEDMKMYFHDGIAMVKIKSKLKLSFLFEEARVGLVVITVYEATGLRNVDPMGQQDPYVQLSIGSTYKKRTKSIKVNTYLYIYAYTHVYMYIFVYVFIYIYINIFFSSKYIYINMYINILLSKYICI
jgi:hypothetical protein